MPSASPGPTVPGGRSVPVESVAVLDARTGDLITAIPVGPDPKLIAVAGQRLWTLNLGDGGLSQIDPASLTVTALRLAGDSVGMASDGDDLWVTHDGRFLTRLDGLTGREEQTIELADQPIFALRDAGFLAVADGSAWLTVPVLGHARDPHRLWRIDTATGAIVATYALGTDPITPIMADGAVWVPVMGTDVILRFDTTSGEALATRLGEPPISVAAGEGSIWVALEGGRRVLRLAPSDGSIVAEIALGARARGVTVGGGIVWVATEAGVEAIDVATSTVTQAIPLVDPPRRGQGPSAIAWFGDRVWVPIE